MVLVALDGQESKYSLSGTKTNMVYVTERAKLRKANNNRGTAEPQNTRIVTTKTPFRQMYSRSNRTM